MPPSPGTFPVTTPLFAALLVSVIVIVGALTFFPALSLGPIVEHLLMRAGTGVLTWRRISQRQSRNRIWDRADRPRARCVDALREAEPAHDDEEPGDVRRRGRQRADDAARCSRSRVAGSAGLGFELQITFWLWFTVLFANFAEAMAEGRGKAQADTLRKARTETVGQPAASPAATIEDGAGAAACARTTS